MARDKDSDGGDVGWKSRPYSTAGTNSAPEKAGGHSVSGAVQRHDGRSGYECGCDDGPDHDGDIGVVCVMNGRQQVDLRWSSLMLNDLASHVA